LQGVYAAVRTRHLHFHYSPGLIDLALNKCIVVSRPFRKERGKDGPPCSISFEPDR